QEYNILIANILANPLIKLLTKFNTLLHPGIRITVFGFMTSQIKTIEIAYSLVFSDLSIKTQTRWALITGIK
ncbi:MAG: 50S ribosomal protein L11 methyltransferase, partial [Fidelibacterota bacterium]